MIRWGLTQSEDLADKEWDSTSELIEYLEFVYTQDISTRKLRDEYNDARERVQQFVINYVRGL